MTNGFIWYELLTSDPDAAARFYNSVIGWNCTESGQNPMDYRMLGTGAAFIGGLMKLPEMAVAAGARPGWLGYINVVNVDKSVADIVKDGGAVHMAAFDIPNVGRIAMVADPQGAPFYVMTPIGTGQSTSFSRGKPGHGGWHELHTSNLEAAYAFYAKHFDWSTESTFDMGPMGQYRVFKSGSGPGMGGMMADAAAPRPYWLYCFNVENIDAAASRVKDSGGIVIMAPVEVPGGEWVLRAQDPQGAVFVLVGPPRQKG